MKKGLNVLSLFGGMECGRIALDKAGILVDNYFSSEIDTAAISVTKSNWPEIIHLGDIRNVYGGYISEPIDLLIGGSPCQDISNLNKNSKGLDGEKSGLFYEFLRLKNETNPKYFLLENVVGNKIAINEITKLMGVEPILIDAAKVSGARRKRYFWTNIPNIEQPKDLGITLEYSLLPTPDEKYFLSGGRLKWLLGESGKRCVAKKFASIDPIKAQCLTARSEPSWNCNYVTDRGRLRKLTPQEYEILQGVPINYTRCVDDIERYKMLGNGWNVDVITHIFKNIPQ